jgi:hypothetical protein
VIPPFVEYKYPVNTVFPESAGAVKARDTCALPPVAVKSVGAPGALYIVGETGMALMLVDATPDPAEFTAFTRIEYDTPFVSPSITITGDDDSGVRVTYVVPPSVLY